jgi:hypothetical protein
MSLAAKVVTISILLILTTGCSQPSQRFVPVPDGGLALDTKTGRYCFPRPVSPVANSPLSQIPLCYDLYKGKA